MLELSPKQLQNAFHKMPPEAKLRTNVDVYLRRSYFENYVFPMSQAQREALVWWPAKRISAEEKEVERKNKKQAWRLDLVRFTHEMLDSLFENQFSKMGLLAEIFRVNQTFGQSVWEPRGELIRIRDEILQFSDISTPLTPEMYKSCITLTAGLPFHKWPAGLMVIDHMLNAFRSQDYMKHDNGFDCYQLTWFLFWEIKQLRDEYDFDRMEFIHAEREKFLENARPDDENIVKAIQDDLDSMGKLLSDMRDHITEWHIDFFRRQKERFDIPDFDEIYLRYFSKHFPHYAATLKQGLNQ